MLDINSRERRVIPETEPVFTIVEGCDFRDYPIGGQLNFAKQLVRAFGMSSQAAGYVQRLEELGVWRKRIVEGLEIEYFGLSLRQHGATRPFVPDRLRNAITSYRRASSLVRDAATPLFVQAPEILISLSARTKANLCYRFPGVDNPLTGARYPVAKYFARIFDRAFASALRKAAVLLYSADEEALANAVSRLKIEDLLPRLHFFPTRVDTSVFRPQERVAVRKRLDIAPGTEQVLFVGRLNAVKGWDLAISGFARSCRPDDARRLVVIGDGEDRNRAHELASQLGVRDRVEFLGALEPEQIAQYLSAADVLVSTSHREGWPTTIVEALACGCPVVTTAVSGARVLVSPGRTGVIVDSRDPEAVAAGLELCLGLPRDEDAPRLIAARYGTDTLRSELEEIWLGRPEGR